MESPSLFRRFAPIALWAVAFFAIYFFVNKWIIPFSDGITLNSKLFFDRLREISKFLLAIFAVIAFLEVYLYQIFFRQPRNPVTMIVIRSIQVTIAVGLLMSIITFFETTDLFNLGEGSVGSFFRFPQTAFTALKGFPILILLLMLFVIIHIVSKPRSSRLGLAYLLVLPAFLGIFFLILYPFLFEIRLAFSNASLGTAATKNASYGLVYGWNNLVTLFTGTVAKDAKFIDVFIRTVLWTVINVSFHVAGGMGLALLLHRPMKLQGVYRMFLIFPWAIPTTIAALALRNEFDTQYGLFNIILGNINQWLVVTAERVSSLFLLGPSFQFLALHFGPVSWKQDPFWAFISILITNIWLGIPFMSVIILGGLQSISREYYEAAEIDGAHKWQQFRLITLPLLRPVLTPAIILGVVWTFNKFDVIYLITQGAPQEKTDILVSSMYKAAFQFYRYGFTAMFALVIFVILLIFTLIYLRASGGLKSVTE